MAITREQCARELAAYTRGVFRTALEPIRARLRVDVDDGLGDGFLVRVRDGGELAVSIYVTRQAVENVMHEQAIDEAFAKFRAAWPGPAEAPAEHPVVAAIGRLGRHQPLR